MSISHLTDPPSDPFAEAVDAEWDALTCDRERVAAIVDAEMEKPAVIAAVLAILTDALTHDGPAIPNRANRALAAIEGLFDPRLKAEAQRIVEQREQDNADAYAERLIDSTEWDNAA